MIGACYHTEFRLLRRKDKFKISGCLKTSNQKEAFSLDSFGDFHTKDVMDKESILWKGYKNPSGKDRPNLPPQNAMVYPYRRVLLTSRKISSTFYQRESPAEAGEISRNKCRA